MAYGDGLDIYLDSEVLTQAKLDLVDNSLDKRQGSVIYDALAPNSVELAQAYSNLKGFAQDTFMITATNREAVIYRAAEAGILPYEATQSKRLGIFTDINDTAITIPLGTQFSTINETVPVYFTVTAVHTIDDIAINGSYVLTCNDYGTIGNNYTGNILPTGFGVNNLKTADISDILIPAIDNESIDSIKTRYFEKLNVEPFGGNIADYKQNILAISGVGGVQIYPTWNGGGTVKCSIINSLWAVPSELLIDTIQTTIDPEVNSGIGLGLAPIGAVVTITSCSELTVNISATITLLGGYTVNAVKPLIQTIIEDYFITLRQQWDDMDVNGEYSLSVFLAQISAKILSIVGVTNVTNILLNGSAADITLTQNSTTQQIPKIGTLTINGV
jgi:uncharacterized phage protein gp47/JayE